MWIVGHKMFQRKREVTGLRVNVAQEKKGGRKEEFGKALPALHGEKCGCEVNIPSFIPS